MRALAAKAGLVDAVIVNSCAVTQEAVRQTRQQIRRARRERPEATLIVTGCAAQIDRAAFAAMPEIDGVIDNDAKLSRSAWDAFAPERVPTANDFVAARETAAPLLDGFGERARAFLQIQNGCDHRCTFCIIPAGRGPSRSTPAAEVLSAARALVADGHCELVLTGVDITSWGGDLEGAPRLGRLVAQLLDEVDGLQRLRLSSIDGAEVDDELFERVASEARVAPHLHLSLQSGDDMILKRMKRRHTRAGAIELCRALRSRRPGVAFGADIIAGFPTETEAMFENSLRLIDDAGLNYVHVFPYSPREGTPAARMPLVDKTVVRTRAGRLREKAASALTQFLDQQIGAAEDAVIESGGRARLGNFASVRLTAPASAPAGSMARVRILARDGDVLVGRPE